MKFNHYGQLQIQGGFQEVLSEENRLEFEFESEQSYLTATLEELKNIVDYYGDLEGVKK
jgi:hypothetical protein